MRALLAILLTFGIITGSFAQQKPENAGSIKEPAGFEEFFEQIGKVMQNYPSAAKRFGIYDSKSSARIQCGPDELVCCREMCPGWPRWCSTCVREGCCPKLQ
jgi:hypothetical protein